MGNTENDHLLELPNGGGGMLKFIDVSIFITMVASFLYMAGWSFAYRYFEQKTKTLATNDTNDNIGVASRKTEDLKAALSNYSPVGWVEPAGAATSFFSPAWVLEDDLPRLRQGETQQAPGETKESDRRRATGAFCWFSLCSFKVCCVVFTWIRDACNA